MDAKPHAQSDRGAGRSFLPPALAVVVIVAFLAFVTLRIILPELSNSIRDRRGATYSFGGWFYDQAAGAPDYAEHVQLAFAAFEAELQSRGFIEDRSYVPTEWGHRCSRVDDTIHLYWGKVGRDEVSIAVCVATTASGDGMDIELSYDVHGFRWDVPDRVAAIQAFKIELYAWLEAYEQDHPVFEKFGRGPRPRLQDR